MSTLACLLVHTYILIHTYIYRVVLCAGGTDKNAVVFNKDTEQVIAVLKGHTKKVTSVIYHPKEVKYLLLQTSC